MNIPHTNLSRYVKSTYLILTLTMVISLIAGLAYAMPAGEDDPKAIITPRAGEYSHTTPPTFDIETGTNIYYKVQLALSKSIFSMTDTDTYKIATDSTEEKRNFYDSGWLECDTYEVIVMSGIASDPQGCTNGIGTYTMDSTAWSKMHASVVFYRLITNTSMSDVGAMVSTIGTVRRTGETWYGLPLNNKVQVYDKVENQNIYVVENGELNGVAFESDYGPRYVTGGTRFHPGLDFSVVKGTPVYAIADGKVVHLPDTGSMGRLNIKHLEGTDYEYLSGYVHLDKAVVALEEEVKAGQLIAYSGNKGTDDYHLHFEAGFRDNDKYHNPLDYVPYTDEHVIRPDLGTFLADNNTNSNAIDVRNSAGDQDIVLISFGVTTDYDKDLNYVSVQVDESTENGWFFVLNYDDVKEHNSSTGVVTLNNGRTFRVRPMGDDIYNDNNLAYDFYVKPAATYTGLGAKDYFFFPWDVSTLENKEDGGPHEIAVTLGEVDDPYVERMLTIGPEVYPTSIDVDQISVTYDLMVYNYDIPENSNGIIQLEVAGKPPGWSTSFSEANPSIVAGGSKMITLTITANPPFKISPDAMRENNTRVIATFGRIPALRDNWVFCPSNVEVESMTATAASSNTINASDEFCPTDPAKVTILKPADNSDVPANKVYKVKVSAPGAASYALASLDVEDLTDRSWVRLVDFSRVEDTFTFNWTPLEVDHEYGLTATVDGFVEPSGTVTVTAVNDEVVFIQPTHMGKVEGGKEMTVIVDAPYGATKVLLEIYPANPSPGGEMVKAADGTWQFSGWVPSKDVEYYNLTATAYENNVQLAYNTIRVEPIPDHPTIDVPLSVNLGETVDVTVTAPRAFAVTLFAPPKHEFIGRDGDIWRFEWTPEAAGDSIVWANASYSNQGDEQTKEVTVHVIDDSQNMIDVIIDEPQNGETVYVGEDTTIRVSTPYGELSKVLVEITDENGQVEEKSFTAEENGGNFASVGIPWPPPEEGKYYIKAYAWDTAGRKGWTPDDEIVEVTAETKPTDPKPTPADTGIWTPINEYAYLWRTKENTSWDKERWDFVYDTEIPSSEYACGIVGFGAKGGDIGENHFDVYTVVPIISVYLETWSTDTDKSWHIRVSFDTLKRNLDDDPERWDRVDVLCIDRDINSIVTSQPGKSILIHTYRSGLGDQVGLHTDKSTGISSDEYVCGIVGFTSGSGDIQEFDDGDIIQSYLFRKNGEWHIRADFRSHNGDNEDWAVTLFCIHRDAASIDSPQAGKPFVLKEYTNLGDNISYPTEFDVNEWVCGVVGFAARDGDIDENDQSDGTNLILAYMQEGTEKWHIRADFRTHNDDESWDVNVLCMHKDLSAPPEMLGAEPQLFTGQDPNGVLYGPGMALTWEETYHPEAKYYEIQFSEDGGTTWQLLDNQRPINLGGWRNHHGSLECGSEFGRCIKRNQVYSYRVRVLDGAQNPITTWSDVISSKSMEWPAHVKLQTPQPKGPYPSTATVEIKIDPQETYGKDLELSWQIISYSSATYTILDNTCATGNLQNSKATTCKLRINRGSNGIAFQSEGTPKLAALEPVPSLKVIVTGTDKLQDPGFTAWRDVYLDFQGGTDPDTTFSDVYEDYWAYPYITYLHDHGFVSGCSVTGESKFCSEDPITREQQAVILVRAEHPQEPGYVPDEVEPEVVPFIDVQDKMTVEVVEGSTTAPASYWGGKWITELYELGLTAGCSEDPPLYCPDVAVTRAQLAVFAVKLHRGEDFKPGDPPYQPFNDVTLYDENGQVTWQARWIMAARSNGLVQNCGTDMEAMLFFPEKAATRAEMACMVYHALTHDWNDIVPPS